MKSLTFALVSISVLIAFVAPGCEDLGVPTHILPSIISFTAAPKSVSQGQVVRFKVSAVAELGLARAIIDYGDDTRRDTLYLSGSSDSASTSHAYLVPGIFKPALTLEDLSKHTATTSDSIFVCFNQLPQIISHLAGTEGMISRAPKSMLVYDPEGDSTTISVSPISPGLVFRLNTSGDSVIYYLANPDDNGAKLARITITDQLNRTVEKVVEIGFDPLDDISGRVHDRFEGTYLAEYRPAAVMQGPLTGWVAVTSGSQTVSVPVDAAGRYAFPKLASTNHTIRTFITNGRDSSFISNCPISPGDRTFDVGVETNAGTSMPLHRLLTLYQTVNFRMRDTLPWNSCLVGMDLKNSVSAYAYYLLGKGMTSSWLTSKSLTADQLSWLGNEIQARCFAHLPPGNRPRIVNANPNDPLPLRQASIGGFPTTVPSSGIMIVYADLNPWTDNVTIWDEMYDGVYDCARIDFVGGDASSPPYGFSVIAIVQIIGKTISGNGSLTDPYYNDKTTRAEKTVLDFPSIADMKLDWQVVFETPKFSNNVEARYFELPH